MKKHGKLVIALGIAVLLSTAVFSGVSAVNTIRPQGIIIHHSAIPPLRDGRPIDVDLINEIHHKRGYQAFYWGRFYHVGYHFIILSDGTVQPGRPEHCRGAHAIGYESFIGVCLVGDFSSNDNPAGERGPKEPTEAQMQALIDLTNRLRQKYGIPLEQVKQHRDVNPKTECPGDRFPFQLVREKSPGSN